MDKLFTALGLSLFYLTTNHRTNLPVSRVDNSLIFFCIASQISVLRWYIGLILEYYIIIVHGNIITIQNHIIWKTMYKSIWSWFQYFLAIRWFLGIYWCTNRFVFRSINFIVFICGRHDIKQPIRNFVLNERSECIPFITFWHSNIFITKVLANISRWFELPIKIASKFLSPLIELIRMDTSNE